MVRGTNRRGHPETDAGTAYIPAWRGDASGSGDRNSRRRWRAGRRIEPSVFEDLLGSYGIGVEAREASKPELELVDSARKQSLTGEDAEGELAGDPRLLSLLARCGRHQGARAHRRPSPGTARHRSQPDRRPDRPVRSAVRMFTEVGVAEAVPGQVGYWRSLIGRAVAAAGDGPVHLNLAFREPLVPDDDPTWPEPLDGRTAGRPWVRVGAGVPTQVDLGEALGGEIPQRGVVVAGDGVADPAAVADLAERLGWPLFAEPTSNARRGPAVVRGYALLLADPGFADRPPDLVLTVGRPGLSRAVLRWIARADRHIVVDPRRRWADPTRTADLVLPALPAVPRRETSEWTLRWQNAGAEAEKVLADLDADPLTEPGVARAIGTALPSGGLLFVGPSRPIRDVDLGLPARDDVRVLATAA